MKKRKQKFVSVPYEITLLSNYFTQQWDAVDVSVPYEITLLSNACLWVTFSVLGFSTL